MWRFALILFIEVLFSSGSASFHTLILLVLWFSGFLLFIYTPSWPKILVAGVVLCVLFLPLQESKWQLRKYANGDEKSGPVQSNLSALDKAALWGSFLSGSIMKTVSGNMDEEFIGETVMRYNQGWIINRVMQHVPAVEPYARGKTLIDALISVFVPRIFNPDKAITGGVENMKIYAGIELTEGTSMNLGYAGEMYANFGYWGGIVGCGLYCMAFGLLFRFLCIRAFVSPLWWAVLAYIGFAALKAEDDVVGVVNWTAKACIVMVGVCYAFPAFRRALFPRQGGRGQTSAKRTAVRQKRTREEDSSVYRMVDKKSGTVEEPISEGTTMKDIQET